MADVVRNLVLLRSSHQRNGKATGARPGASTCSYPHSYAPKESQSGKSKGGLSKGGLGPKGANWAKKGTFGAISALPPWLWGAEELVPIGPEKALIAPEEVPICPEKARFCRKDFPPIFSENLGLKPPFVSPPLDFPNSRLENMTIVQFKSGEAFSLTVGAFLLTGRLLCLQSLKALIRRTFPL